MGNGSNNRNHAHHAGGQGVVGSNPAAPTIFFPILFFLHNVRFAESDKLV